MFVNDVIIPFQIDTSNTVNILPREYLAKNERIHKTDVILKTWNKEKYQHNGHCRNIVENSKYQKKYNVNFIVCNDDFTPIIGLPVNK